MFSIPGSTDNIFDRGLHQNRINQGFHFRGPFRVGCQEQRECTQIW